MVGLKPRTQPGDVVVQHGQGIPHVDHRGGGDRVIHGSSNSAQAIAAAGELLRALATEFGEEVNKKAHPVLAHEVVGFARRTRCHRSLRAAHEWVTDEGLSKLRGCLLRGA